MKTIQQRGISVWRAPSFMNTIFGVLILILSTCAVQANTTAKSYGELRHYEKLNPYNELKKAVTNNDLRFMALMGFGIYVPGVKDHHEKYKKYGFRIIKGAGDDISGYEHGRLIEIARYYASTYNRMLKLRIAEIESLDMAKNLPGYKKLLATYNIERAYHGNINSLPYSFHVNLLSKAHRCVNSAWWFNPIEEGVLKYDWMDFEKINNEIEQAACAHSWIGQWIKAGKDRVAESQVFGIRPFTTNDIEATVATAWQAAKLKSEPYYEIFLRQNGRAVGTLFIGKDKENAIITQSDPTGDTHWLDQFEFYYHPKAEQPTFIVVSKNGQWKKVED